MRRVAKSTIHRILSSLFIAILILGGTFVNLQVGSFAQYGTNYDYGLVNEERLTEPLIQEAQVVEDCFNGLDDDFDGFIDGGDGDCLPASPAGEDCFNGFDDDGDGLADGQDGGDCDTATPEPEAEPVPEPEAEPVPEPEAEPQAEPVPEPQAEPVPEPQAEPSVLEICDNGVEDDGDGLTDEQDEDCPTILVAPRCPDNGDTTECPSPNSPPLADAGEDQEVASKQSVILNGIGSHDPDGNVTSFRWIQIGGEPTISLQDSDTIQPNFVTPIVSNESSLTFELMVTDDNQATNKDSVDILVNPSTTSDGPEPSQCPDGNMTDDGCPFVDNIAPVAEAGEDQIVDEGAITSSVPAPDLITRTRIPTYLWGAATSAYQVEGGITNNDWDFFATNPEIKDRINKITSNSFFYKGSPISLVPAREAVREWNPDYYEKDFESAKQVGLNALRVGIEWARVEPQNNQWNLDAIEHYKQMIRTLNEKGITPIITLHHFTLPIWVLRPPTQFTHAIGQNFLPSPLRDVPLSEPSPTDEYWDSLRGWENPATIREFDEFVKKIVSEFKGQVDYWITLNEPVGSYIGLGYLAGLWSPGFFLDGHRSKKVLHNLVQAHVNAYDIISAEDNVDSNGDGIPKSVGFSHAVTYVKPAKNTILDIPTSNSEAAKNFDYFTNEYFLNAVINGEEDLNYLNTLQRHNTNSRDFILQPGWKNKVDFVGVNYYRAMYVRFDPILALSSARFVGGVPLNDLRLESHAHANLNDLGWEIYPQGLYDIIMRIKNQWDLPILISENGAADKYDNIRAPYIVSHLSQVKRAMDSGADVFGYIFWSLMDNYEWQAAYRPDAKFGLYSVDRNSNALDRSPTKGLEALQYIIRESKNDSASASALSKAQKLYGAYSSDGLRLISPVASASNKLEAESSIESSEVSSGIPHNKSKKPEVSPLKIIPNEPPTEVKNETPEATTTNEIASSRYEANIELNFDGACWMRAVFNINDGDFGKNLVKKSIRTNPITDRANPVWEQVKLSFNGNEVTTGRLQVVVEISGPFWGSIYDSQSFDKDKRIYNFKFSDPIECYSIPFPDTELGNNTQILENDTNIGDPSNTVLETSMLENDTNIGDPSNTLLDTATSKFKIWLSASDVGQQPGFISFCAFGQAISIPTCQYFDMTDKVINAGKPDFMVGYVEVESTMEPTANGDYVAVCAESQKVAWSNEQPGEWNDCDTPIQQNNKGDYFVAIDFSDLEHTLN